MKKIEITIQSDEFQDLHALAISTRVRVPMLYTLSVFLVTLYLCFYLWCRCKQTDSDYFVFKLYTSWNNIEFNVAEKYNFIG